MTTPHEQGPPVSSIAVEAKRRARLTEGLINHAETLAANARQGGALDVLPSQFLVEKREDLLVEDRSKPGWSEKLEVIDSALSYYQLDASLSRPSRGIGLGLGPDTGPI